MNQCRFSSDKARIIRMGKIKASEIKAREIKAKESLSGELPGDKVSAGVKGPGVAC
ncbi:MAG: hypothetical protein ABIS30_10965 [Gallionella sp.]|jgi:hypothetical protein